MLINWTATKARFDEKFSQAKVARGITVAGEPVNKVTFCRILNGKYPHMDSPIAQAVVAKLKDLDVLVLMDEAA